MRLVPGGAGLAWVDEQTPQLGVALSSEFQHQGIGRPMMQAAPDAARAAGHRRVSLTVHPQHLAIHLHERCGFRTIGLRNTYHLMVAERA